MVSLVVFVEIKMSMSVASSVNIPVVLTPQFMLLLFQKYDDVVDEVSSSYFVPLIITSLPPQFM